MAAVYVFKVIVMGPWGVGKTSLCRRYAEGYFEDSYKSTIGCDILSKREETDKLGTVSLQIWDLGGQERFKQLFQMIETFFLGARGGLAVFDLTNRQSFLEIPSWIKMCRERSGNIPIILIGNKKDLPKREVNEKEAISLVKKLNLVNYIETSAKTGENVNRAFKSILELIIKNI